MIIKKGWLTNFCEKKLSAMLLLLFQRPCFPDKIKNSQKLRSAHRAMHAVKVNPHICARRFVRQTFFFVALKVDSTIVKLNITVYTT